MIVTVGDGSYMFGNPLPYHYVGRAENLPTLTIITNNMMWGAVRQSTLDVYPDGRAAKANVMPLTELKPSPDFEKVIETCGGHGEKVEGPAGVHAGARAQPRRGALGHAGDAQCDDAGTAAVSAFVVVVTLPDRRGAHLLSRPRAGHRRFPQKCAVHRVRVCNGIADRAAIAGAPATASPIPRRD